MTTMAAITTPAVSIFATQRAALYSYFDVELQFRDKLMGGTPKDPKVIEGWLRTKTGVSGDEEIKQMMARTLAELGVEDTENLTYEDLLAASEKLAKESRNTNGFKHDDEGLYIESRQIKASLKESVHILYAKSKWGPTGKGPKSYVAERVYPGEDRIHLGRSEPDGVELQIGTVSGPQGQRQTLTYYEYVMAPKIEFSLMVLQAAEGELNTERWAEIWMHQEENGIGAIRSMGHGRFDVTKFDRRPGTKKRKSAKSNDADTSEAG